MGGRAQRFSDTEIRYEAVVTGEENILGFDVPVHYALRVRVLERFGDVAKDPDRIGDRQFSGALKSRAQRLAFDAGHRVIKKILFRAGEEKRNDMRVLQPRCELNLATKPVDIEARTQLRGQNFYDDVATERDFADDEDPRHSTAQVCDDLVAVAERALKALGQISYRFLIQANSALGE